MYLMKTFYSNAPFMGVQSSVPGQVTPEQETDLDNVSRSVEDCAAKLFCVLPVSDIYYATLHRRHAAFNPTGFMELIKNCVTLIDAHNERENCYYKLQQHRKLLQDDKHRLEEHDREHNRLLQYNSVNKKSFANRFLVFLV
ncbi:hypothetical protein KUTeg_003938 [Tegillarca granosa]|uniref:Uncharacterized protein n=1 Tax=Tegillarca granosa TaxID=220873 RepID=A0ABQ9FNJ5_TEGGR|nr:hypothetical protein KUTeg_003938 [Tegillarca granosa]